MTFQTTRDTEGEMAGKRYPVPAGTRLIQIPGPAGRILYAVANTSAITNSWDARYHYLWVPAEDVEAVPWRPTRHPHET